MGVFGRFSRNKSEEITLQGIQSNASSLDIASNEFLENFGPAFTETPEGHIATDIAGASSIAGLMALRSTNIDLSNLEPGNVILGEEINQKIEPVMNYIGAIGQNMGVSLSEEIPEEILDKYKPLFDTTTLTSKLENAFYIACEKANTPRLYYPIAAALTAMKLVGAGKDMEILDPAIGVNIAMYHTISGSKTVPQPV